MATQKTESIQETIRDIRDRERQDWFNRGKEEGLREGFVNGLECAARARETAPKMEWNSCDNPPTTEGTEILILAILEMNSTCLTYITGYYNKTVNHWYGCNNDYGIIHPTAWLPFPNFQSPKEEGPPPQPQNTPEQQRAEEAYSGEFKEEPKKENVSKDELSKAISTILSHVLKNLE